MKMEMNIKNEVEIEVTERADEGSRDTIPQDIVITPPLASIVHDPFFDCRVAFNDEAIERYTGRLVEYKEAVERGEERDYPFYPIIVWRNDGRYVRITGGHRIKAAENAGLGWIKAEVFIGTKADALKIALLDNGGHGVR